MFSWLPWDRSPRITSGEWTAGARTVTGQMPLPTLSIKALLAEH